MRNLSSALFILVIASVIAGCGDKAGSAANTPVGSQIATTTSTESTSLLIAQADKICGHLNTVFAASKPKSEGIDVIARVVPGRVVLEERTLAQLGKLTPPQSLAHDWQQIIDYRQALAHELAVLGQKAKAHDKAAVAVLVKSKQDVHDKLLAVASRDGFKQCGRVGSG